MPVNSAVLVIGYRWESSGGSKACTQCQALHGQEFYYEPVGSQRHVDEMPTEQLHPNCRCRRRAIHAVKRPDDDEWVGDGTHGGRPSTNLQQEEPPPPGEGLFRDPILGLVWRKDAIKRGPVYGNYGGLGWTGGKDVDDPSTDPTKPPPKPIDQMDEHFEKHDRQFTNGKNERGDHQSNKELLQSLRDLPKDPRTWSREQHDKPMTEQEVTDANRIRSWALWYFGGEGLITRKFETATNGAQTRRGGTDLRTWMKAIRAPLQNFWLPLTCIVLFSFCMSCTHVPYPNQRKGPSVRYASFSPKENLIAFAFTSIAGSGIFLMNRQGEVRKWLTEDPPGHWHVNPVFSPDGQKIAFVSFEAGAGDRGNIYVIDKDGQNARQLTSSGDHDRNPRFSLDGGRIYFIRHDSWGSYPDISSRESWDSDIYYVNLSDGKVHQVTDQEFYRLYGFSVFPDEKHLLINTTAYVQKGYLLWKMNISDQKQVSPIEPDLTKFNPQPRYNYLNMYKFLEIIDTSLSRDGKFLAFDWQNPSYTSPGNWIGDQVYVTDMDNMQTTKLSNVRRGAGVADISPDNEQVLFLTVSNMDYSNCCYVKKSNLWIINRDGSGLRNFSLDFTAVMKQQPPNPKPTQ